VNFEVAGRPRNRRVEGEDCGGQLLLLEAQVAGLQLLVSDLLRTNQDLRQELAQLEWIGQLTAPATHPQPRPDRSTAG